MENLDHLLGDFKFEAKYLNRPFFSSLLFGSIIYDFKQSSSEDL